MAKSRINVSRDTACHLAGKLVSAIPLCPRLYIFCAQVTQETALLDYPLFDFQQLFGSKIKGMHAHTIPTKRNTMAAT